MDQEFVVRGSWPEDLLKGAKEYLGRHPEYAAVMLSDECLWRAEYGNRYSTDAVDGKPHLYRRGVTTTNGYGLTRGPNPTLSEVRKLGRCPDDFNIMNALIE